MTRRMLFNLTEPEESRVAVLEEGELQEIILERRSSASRWGNIYKGRVVNVEPSIQAAFVEIGEGDRGFLHITDVSPAAIGASGDGRQELAAKPTPDPEANSTLDPQAKPAPDRDRRIQELLFRGQEIVAQITRDGIGDKGPTLTTYLSLPGRYVVIMPQIKKSGVSRKIVDRDKRREIREKLAALEPPREAGFIVRTAGEDATAEELKADMDYLLHLWKRIEARAKETPAVVTLHEEGDLVARTLRDLYMPDVSEILVDTEEGRRRAVEFLRLVSPGDVDRVKLHLDREPLFHRFRVEQEIERIYRKEVPLASGGRLVIEPTEALVAIDVNSGRYTAQDNIEETAVAINLEAAREIGRQLRLRDLGGVVVIDFIDMKEERNRRRVEEAFRAELKKDRARTRATRLSQFGLIELTRQRIGPSVRSQTHVPCASCEGRGWVKSPESLWLEVLRAVRRGAAGGRTRRIEVCVSPLALPDLQNRYRRELARLEDELGLTVDITGHPGLSFHGFDARYFDGSGNPVRL